MVASIMANFCLFEAYFDQTSNGILATITTTIQPNDFSQLFLHITTLLVISFGNRLNSYGYFDLYKSISMS